MTKPGAPMGARFLSRADIGVISGAVVAIDVLRAFSTAAYAFEAGAKHIFLVADVEEALAFKRANPGSLAMGEVRGLMPEGFDFSNSPAAIATHDLEGRTLVQRTSGGTPGVIAARHATRLWCASLVNASATARAVQAAALGAPAYVITGRLEERPGSGLDDLTTAEFIDSVRVGTPLERAGVCAAVAATDEAQRTRALGAAHAHERDIDSCLDIDRFDFAMEVTRVEGQLRLDKVLVG